MDSLTCTLEGKPFLALLTSLTKRQFYGEAITVEDIAEQLFAGSDLENAQIVAQISAFDELLRRAAESNWDTAKFEDILSQSNISKPNASVVIQFWNGERDKMHARLVKESVWNNRLKNVSWRVDVKTASNSSTEMNEPVAIMELMCEAGHKRCGEASQPIRFEMNRNQLADLTSTLENIQKTMESFAN